tara:strand:+ start:53 stop:1318 length:1266 start_codon:yes stop_codon:yes gene_type:complete
MMQQKEKVKEYSKLNESSLNTEEILNILNKTKGLNFLKEDKIFENLSSEFKSLNLKEIAKKNNTKSSTSQKKDNSINEKEEKELNASSDSEKENILESEKNNIDLEGVKKQEKIYTQEQHEKLIDDAREKGFKEGIQRGFKQGEKNIKDELQKGEKAQALALKNTIDNLFHVTPEFSKKLNETINESIKKICNQMLGYKISEMPKKFLDKIDNLVLSIENSSNKIVVFLNTEDQKVLNDFLKSNKTLTDITFKTDETLNRGDLIIKSGGIEINDISSKKFSLTSNSNLDENLKELANKNYAEIEKAKINDIDQNPDAQIEDMKKQTMVKNENIQNKLQSADIKTQFSETSKIPSGPYKLPTNIKETEFNRSEESKEDSILTEKLSNKVDDTNQKAQIQTPKEEKPATKIETTQKNDDTIKG